MAGENLDLTNDSCAQESPYQDGLQQRRFVGIHFACCSVYARIYVNRTQSAYEGNCPRCSRPVRLRIGPGGTDKRFFTAY